VLYFKEDGLAKIEYSKSLTKKCVYAAVTLAFTISGSFYLAMEQRATIPEILLFLSAAIVIYLWVNYKFIKNATCPHCGRELFNAIMNAKMYRIKFNYCPTCGGKIEI